MSLALVERSRLATPVELSTSPPPKFAAPDFDVPDLGTYDGTPAYVLAARRFAESHQGSAAAFVQVAQAEQTIHDNDAALAAAERALSLIPRQGDDPLVFAALQVQLACGRRDLAVKALQRIKNNEVRDLLRARLAIESGRLGDAAQLLESLDSPDALAAQGWIELEFDRYDRAVHLYRRAIASGGVSPAVLANLGYAHGALGSRAKAIKVTRQARALAPKDEAFAFNLVCFYMADGDFEAARHELAQMRDAHPTRLRFDVAEADLYMQVNEPGEAYSILRRARQSALWAYAEPCELAELEANLAFVEWRLGKTSRESAAKTAIDQLHRNDCRSLDIACLLPALLSTAEDETQVEGLYDKLSALHGRDAMLFLETHLAILQYRFRDAAELAVEWASKEIFNSHAAGVAVYLLTDAMGDFDRAYQVGTRALRTSRATEELVNNVAYSFALGGRLTEARELLSEHRTGDSVYFHATEGLIEVLSGNTERGRALYHAAYKLAQMTRDRDLPDMVSLNETLAMHRTGVEHPSLELPSGWQRSPYWVLFKEAAERAGLSCSPSTSSA